MRDLFRFSFLLFLLFLQSSLYSFAHAEAYSSINNGNQDEFDPNSVIRSNVNLEELELPFTGRFPNGFDPLAPSCAEKLILDAAKKNVSERFGNNPTGSGTCAFGVRTSLQLSGVGGITEGLGNAIDYIQNLPPRGFVDSGLRNLDQAPPGSILVFSGPKSQEYLKNGEFGSPAGDWLGHVTIVGDDGKFYTDGRTREPALGWSGHRNVSHIRNLVGVYVPGPELVLQFHDKCAR